MTEKKNWKIIPEDIPEPSKAGRKAKSKYDPILDKFLNSNRDEARIEHKTVEDETLAVGLRNRIKKRQLNLAVHTRKDSGVYLKRLRKSPNGP